MRKGHYYLLASLTCFILSGVFAHREISDLVDPIACERAEYVRLLFAIKSDTYLYMQCITHTLNEGATLRIELLVDIYNIEQQDAELLVKYFELKSTQLPRIDAMLGSESPKTLASSSTSLGNEIRGMLPCLHLEVSQD